MVSISPREALRRVLSSFRPPASTYRLQMSARFTLHDAAGLVPYLASLGIDAVYTSPIFRSVPASDHGYNILDPNQLSPELGGEEGYAAFQKALDAHGLFHLLDVVPNHLAVHPENTFWNDVLEDGRASVYADFFDIDWDPVKKELKDKVLMPVLGGFYGKALESGDIRVEFTGDGFAVRYFEHKYPVNPSGCAELLEEAAALCESADSASCRELAAAFLHLPPPEGPTDSRHADRYLAKQNAKARLSQAAAGSPALTDALAGAASGRNGKPGEPRSFDALHSFLERQAYRLSYWRVAFEEINYRRFFNINELAAVRMEDERVFLRCHDLLFRLVRDGKVKGLRIDHPDGLYDPPGYFRDLQALCAAALTAPETSPALTPELLAAARELCAQEEFAGRPALYTVAEKILNRHERLPDDWSVHGTVGYDYLNLLNGLFVMRGNAESFDTLYEAFIGHRIDAADLARDAKHAFVDGQMTSEVNALAHRLERIAEADRCTRDFTLNDLKRALRATIECFPVYRTYLGPGEEPPAERDREVMRAALGRARRREPRLDSSVFDFLYEALAARTRPEAAPGVKTLLREFALRFQQVTGPIMAKGLEDTAFYVHNRLLSLNEVGGDPAVFGVMPEEFHAANEQRAERWPAGMITTSTHDTKRSHDARSRLNALSEMPGEWEEALGRWSALNARKKTVLDGEPMPRPNTEYSIYQTLLAAWPDEPLEGAAREAFAVRIAESVKKSVREAGIYTNWINPDDAYEAAVEKFLRALLADSAFEADFAAFAGKLSRFGKWNSLSSLTLKLASPGALDTYQGEELWRYSLVDPDNRRLIDFDEARGCLAGVESASPDEVAAWAASLDGRAKLHLLREGLRLRRRFPDLFLSGGYRALSAEGPAAERVVAFARESGSRRAVAAAARFFVSGNDWAGTALTLPSGPVRWRDAFTGRSYAGPTIEAACLFETFPGVILMPEGDR